MKEAASNFGQKAIAVVVLLIAAWILLKLVFGFLAGIFWIGLVVVAIGAILWALNTLA